MIWHLRLVWILLLSAFSCHIIRKLRIWSYLPKISLMENFIFCAVVCLKSITLAITFLSLLLLLLCQFFRNIGEFAAKKKFHRPINNEHNQVICHYKRRFLWSILFLSKSQQRVIPQRLIDKCSSLLI